MERKQNYDLKVLDIDYLKWKSEQPKNACVLRARRKLRILKRDHFKCTECGTDKLLTIHHHKFVKQYYAKGWTSYKLDACKTVCVNCHKHINKNGGMNGKRILGGLPTN
jgi:5-methylcytosine-specific restriction endonuclease McrA